MLSETQTEPRPWQVLGVAVGEARRAAGLTPTELAALVDISHAQVVLIEAGRCQPAADVLRLMVEKTGAQGRNLFALADYPPEEPEGPLPPGIVAVIRRMLAKGLDEKAFLALEEMAARLPLERQPAKAGAR